MDLEYTHFYIFRSRNIFFLKSLSSIQYRIIHNTGHIHFSNMHIKSEYLHFGYIFVKKNIFQASSIDPIAPGRVNTRFSLITSFMRD